MGASLSMDQGVNDANQINHLGLHKSSEQCIAYPWILGPLEPFCDEPHFKTIAQHWSQKGDTSKS